VKSALLANGKSWRFELPEAGNCLDYPHANVIFVSLQDRCWKKAAPDRCPILENTQN
jgi:hypothetical protein